MAAWAQPGRGAGRAQGHRRWRGLRGPRGGRRAGSRGHARHADRPQRLQHLPATAVSGRDRRAESRRHRLSRPGLHPQAGCPVPARRADQGGRGGAADHAGRRRAIRVRLPHPGDGRLGRVLRRDRCRRAHRRPVHAPGRGDAAEPHHVPAGASGHHRPRQGRELHRRRRRGDRRGTGRGAGRAARDRTRRRVSRGRPVGCTHQAGRTGAGPARAVPSGAAGVRPPGAGWPRGGDPPVHRDP